MGRPTLTAVTVSALVPLFVLFSNTMVSGQDQCRPVCSGSLCVIITKDQVDFKNAEERCRARKGELMTFQPATDHRLLDTLRQKLDGDFWIGLSLPAGTCSDLSAPLRGYEWTSGSTSSDVIVSWREDVVVCSPRCVSLSSDGKWTERPCSQRADGFLCRTHRSRAVQAQEVSDPEVFKSPKGCSEQPCQHFCTAVPGGYKCSCHKGYAPDQRDRHLCKVHCATEKCPPLCDGQSGVCATCPFGFILDDNMCLDIDECHMKYCDQDCKNTIGSFVCSCRQGFALSGEVKCVKVDGGQRFPVTTPVVSGFVKPATKNGTLAGSSGAAGGFLWVWVFLAVAVVVIICVVRFYVVKRQKQRHQSANQRSRTI